MSTVAGNYLLNVKFGDQNVPIMPNSILRCVIMQDLNKLLPTFNMRLADPSGILTHIMPFDRGMSRISIQIADPNADTVSNAFEFVAYRKRPISEAGTSSVYDISGVLDIDGMFAPDRCRANTGTISSFLEDVATEMGISKFEISKSLSYKKTVLQPQWSNIELLNDLKERLVGSSDEYAFQIFIKNKDGFPTFVCRSLKELMTSQIQYKFISGNSGVQDCYPMFSYKMFDNYKLYGAFGTRAQKYMYFDYDTSSFIEDTSVVDDAFSLSQFFMIDGDDSDDSESINMLGRSHEFTSDFKNEVNASYHNRLNNLSKLWLTTFGIPNICPGDVVQVLFGHGIDSGNLFSYQYSGYWMVERVLHMFGSTYKTKLLLTRCGVDTDRSSTLVKATKVRMA